MQTPHKFISRFSPNRTAPEDLERINVQRQDLLERSVAVLRESALTENKHHLLFVGPRGCGKTHLIALIYHRLKNQADLDDRLRIAWLNEDETSTSFLDLLLRIYRALADAYPVEFPATDTEALKGRQPTEALELLEKALVSRIGQRTVLVLVENLDALFRQLEESDQRSWRAFVQNHPVFATAATAQSLFAGVSERDQPFFGFFDTTHLQPLTADEAIELLRRIARLNQDAALTEFLGTPRGKARVRAIYHLSGGNHRLYIALSDFITCASLDELVRPFEQMVDEQLTPYYQERLRWLSPQQRKIVEFLSFRARPVPVKDIASALFAEHSSIAGQLQKLREMAYVRPNPRGRESLYELAEPLMRLSMEVKSTGSHQPLQVIVDFLRVWFERGELEQLSTHCDTAGLGFKYLSAALEKLQSGQPDLRRELLLQGIEDVDIDHCDLEQLERLRLLVEDSKEPVDWMNYALGCLHHQQFATALECFDRVVKLPGATVGQVALAFGNQGVCHSLMGQHQAAIAEFTHVVDLAGAPIDLVAVVLRYRGICFGRMGQHQAAIADFTRVVEMPHAPTEQVARALNNRGGALNEMERHEEATTDYTRAIELPEAPAEPVALAFLSRAFTLIRMDRAEDGIADLAHAIQLPGIPSVPAALALVARGTLLDSVGKAEEAKADFIRAIELPGAPAETVSVARGGLALILFEAGSWDLAVKHLAACLGELQKPAPTIARVSYGLIRAIFGQIGSMDVWQARVTQALALYREHNVVVFLGGALVQYLSHLKESPLSNAGLDQWLDGWKALAKDDAAMQVPLRLLSVGIAYLKTQPRDEGVLLQLSREERSLVRQALGLPPEPSE